MKGKSFGETMKSIAMVGDSHSVTHFKYLQPILESKGMSVGYYKPKVGWSARAFITRDDVNIHDMPQGLDVAVIALGGNNFELNEETYFGRLDTFIDRLKQSGIKKIVWMGPMFTREDIDPETARKHNWTRQAQEKYFKNKPYYWIDMYPYSQEGHASDGVHFNSSQYESMINNINGIVVKALKMPYWLVKPQFYWIPLLLLAGIGTVSYIGYEYLTSEDT